jgi:hypothetical protein
MLKMRDQRSDEDRIEYLAKVLYEFMHMTIAGECTIFYDDADCDGMCLAQEFMDALGIERD